MGQSYFQQKVDYRISASLDEINNSLAATAEVTYHNNSNDDLDKIIFHLWMNAFQGKTTEYAKSALKLGDNHFYFADEEQLGGYTNVEFYINDVLVDYSLYSDGDNSYADIVQLQLPKVLKTSESIVINIKYTLDIPHAFSRTGLSDSLYQMTYWYPKPAVYDNDGWHPMSYVYVGEFFSEFGDYEVELTVPISFSAVATGVENDNKSRLDIDSRSRTLFFEAQNVHDFAWFASEYYIPYTDALEIGDNIIKVNLFVKEDNEEWESKMEYAKNAVQYFSDAIGTYPYPQVTVVESACGDEGGMEYPMITYLDFCNEEQVIDHLIAHEIGHNWFYGVLANNEREHAWMDEGLTTHFDHLYNDLHYDKFVYNEFFPIEYKQGDNFSILEQLVLHFDKSGYAKKLNQNYEDFDYVTYLTMNYEKTNWIFKYLKAYIGEDQFEKGLQTYYALWKFKHPKPADLIDCFENASNKDLSDFFNAVFDESKRVDWSIRDVEHNDDFFKVKIKNIYKSKLPYQICAYDAAGKLVDVNWYDSHGENDTIINFRFNSNVDYLRINGEDPFFEVSHRNNNYKINKILPKRDPLDFKFARLKGNSNHNTIHVLPTPFYNRYDGFMLGLGLYNNVFPQEDLRWFINPNYGFKSSDLAGKFSIEKDLKFENGPIRSLTFGLQGQQFHNEDNTLFDYDLKYRKLTPLLRMNFGRNLYGGSFLQYKLHHIEQDDVVFENQLPVVLTGNRVFNVHQVHFSKFGKQNLRFTNFDVFVEYEEYDQPNDSKGRYLKTAVDWQNSFAYKTNSHFDIRFYAAYFPINTQRESSNYADVFTRGSIALSGQGVYDHTYEDYYFSRTGNNGEASSQINIVDAGFKNTFDYYTTVGMSNNYTLAMNLKSDVPFKILGAIDLAPYFDLAYASTKSVNLEPLSGELFYSGGLSIELGEILGIYLPMVNSNNIKINYGGSSLLSRLSFKVNLNALDIWKFVDKPVLSLK